MRRGQSLEVQSLIYLILYYFNTLHCTAESTLQMSDTLLLHINCNNSHILLSIETWNLGEQRGKHGQGTSAQS